MVIARIDPPSALFAGCRSDEPDAEAAGTWAQEKISAEGWRIVLLYPVRSRRLQWDEGRFLQRSARQYLLNANTDSD